MNGQQRHFFQLNDQIISKLILCLIFLIYINTTHKQIHQNPNPLPKMQFIFDERNINENNIYYMHSQCKLSHFPRTEIGT